MTEVLTHLNDKGEAHMVDVGDKQVTMRLARAVGYVEMLPSTLEMIAKGENKKGDVFATSRIAGIMAAKKCADLIPLCHSLNLSSVSVELAPYTSQGRTKVRIECTCKLDAKTGVEMEALTGVSVAALTLYDMCKAVDKTMNITDVRLLEKKGGRSGEFHAEDV